MNRYAPRVPAEPVRIHVKELMRQGMGLTTISEAAGVSYSSLYQMLHGRETRNTPPSVTVTAATARRVMAVQHKPNPLLVDASRSKEHVQRLMNAGLGWVRIAHLAGVSRSAMQTLLQGDPRTGRPKTCVSPMTERRILAVTADPANFPDCALIDGTVTRRKLEALIASGWSMQKLAQHLGTYRQVISKMLARNYPITAKRVRMVNALYEELWDKQPPLVTGEDRRSYTVTVGFAQEKGYRRPMDWDDIDDLAEQPLEVDHTYVDEVAVRRVLDGLAPATSLTRAEKQEAVRQLTARGRALSTAAGQVGLALKFAREAVAA